MTLADFFAHNSHKLGDELSGSTAIEGADRSIAGLGLP